MRFFIMTDMEGVSGVVEFDAYTNRTSPRYEKSVRLATMEINACIEGILSTGDHDILVADGHGQGAIDIELLHPRAEVLLGRGFGPTFCLEDGHFDGMFIVGQHAKKNTKQANLHHTQDHVNVKSLTVCGHEIGETGQMALVAGALGIPTLFLSGDQAACREVEQLIPGVVTAAVKRGVTEESAICLPPVRAREVIRQQAAQAVGQIGKIKPLVFDAPYTATWEFLTTRMISNYLDNPNYQVEGLKVSMQADNLFDLMIYTLWGE
nr:M55 family metallopeptidase [bacterium]